MARQKDYLSSLLQQPDTPPPPGDTAASPRPRAASLLGQRDTALQRVASGEVRQVTQLELDPARVRVWPGNARQQAALTEASCRDLIDAIIAEGGQKVPAVVRRVRDDPDHEYEVIAGTRRHWTISWLRANSYPQMRFLAQVADLDDEAAFRLADIENRARRDISDLERARNYAAALAAHYGGHQNRMADRLRVSAGWLSKMLKVATLPDAVVAAFPSSRDVQLKPAYQLAQALDDPARAKVILDRAAVLARTQSASAAAGEGGVGAAEVMKRLLAPADPRENAPLVVRSRLGRPLVSVAATSRQGVTLKLHAGAGANDREILEAIEKLLLDLKARGRGLRP